MTRKKLYNNIDIDILLNLKKKFKLMVKYNCKTLMFNVVDIIFKNNEKITIKKNCILFNLSNFKKETILLIEDYLKKKKYNIDK